MRNMTEVSSHSIRYHRQPSPKILISLSNTWNERRMELQYSWEPFHNKFQHYSRICTRLWRCHSRPSTSSCDWWRGTWQPSPASLLSIVMFYHINKKTDYTLWNICLALLGGGRPFIPRYIYRREAKRPQVGVPFSGCIGCPMLSSLLTWFKCSRWAPWKLYKWEIMSVSPQTLGGH